MSKVHLTKAVDPRDLKNFFKDFKQGKVKFVSHRRHYIRPGKKGEYIYMVASTQDNGDNCRTWGWVKTEKEAREAVAHNAGDMNEANYYSYCLIEKVASGIFCINSTQMAWFKWKNKKNTKSYEGRWVECPQPAWAKNIVNWTLG